MDLTFAFIHFTFTQLIAGPVVMATSDGTWRRGRRLVIVTDTHTHILLYFPQPVHCIVTWMVCSGDWMVREEVHRIPAVCCGVSDEIRGKRKDPSFLSSHAAHPPTMITSSPTCHVEVRALKWPSWGDPGQVTWLLSSLRTPRTLTSAGAWWWQSGGGVSGQWSVRCRVYLLQEEVGGDEGGGQTAGGGEGSRLIPAGPS